MWMCQNTHRLLVGLCLIVWGGSCRDTLTQWPTCFPYTMTRKHISVDQLRTEVESFRASSAFLVYYYADASNSFKLFSKRLASKCGRRLPVSPIVSGQMAARHAWPWQALVMSQKFGAQILCGGTLVSDQWLVTAGHCLHQKPDGVTVILGVANSKEFNPAEQKFFRLAERDVHVHPDFTHATGSVGDIALIKLPHPVEFTPYVRPACLVDAVLEVPKMCLTMGWGSTTDALRPKGSLNLKQIDIYVYQRACSQSPEFYCGWTLERNRSGMCTGDSGGPLLCEHGGVFYIRGVVSHGYEDCDQRLGSSPGFYTNVSYYFGWIKKIVQG